MINPSAARLEPGPRKLFLWFLQTAIPLSLMNCLSCSSLNARKNKNISLFDSEAMFSFSQYTWASEKVSTDFPRSLL